MDAAVLRGIVRIAVGAARGTGFVVRLMRAPGGSDILEILTALHVVADLPGSRADAPAWRGPKAELRLYGGQSIEVPLNTNAWRVDTGEDWALLRLQCSAPPDISALPLARFEEWPRSRKWETYGYGDAAPDTGAPLSGDVELVEPNTLHLFGKQAGNGGLVSGHSGGPCVFEGHVVGILLSALQNQKRQSINGTLYALPIETIADACQLRLAPGPQVFETDVEAALSDVRGAALLKLARDLCVPPMQSEDALRLWIARAILLAEPRSVVDALGPCMRQVQLPHRIVEMALTRRVRREGVEAVRQCFRDDAAKGVVAVAQRVVTIDLTVAKVFESFDVARRHYAYVDSKDTSKEAWSENIRSNLLGILGLAPDELEDGASLDDHLRARGGALLAFAFDPAMRPLDEVERYEKVRALAMMTRETAASFARDGYRVATVLDDLSAEKNLEDERSAAVRYFRTKG